MGVIFLFTLFLFESSILAQNSRKIKATIIFDFTGEKGEPASSYIFGGKDIYTIITKLGMNVTDVIDGSKDRQAFLEKLKKKYKRGTDNRWISKKQDILEVFVFYRKKNGKLEPKVEFEEKSRKAKLAKDLSVLLKIVVAIVAKGVPPDIEMARTTYQLGKKRAILTVSASLGGKKTSKVEVITGSREHWFLSTDLPVAKLSDVKFVQDKGTVEPRETPKHLYLGMNWMIGDILAEKQNLLKNFFFKVMLKMSRAPLDGYGIGIGYRFPKVRLLGIDISSFSMFASFIWTKEEIENKTEELKKRQFLFGISYNLDKALGWVK
jgi:hypothetical protein